MAVKFAKRMNALKTSEIREILKLTQRPSVISFAGGLPAAEAFPVDEMRDAATRALERAGWRALQYSTTEGHPPLREAIAARMARTMGAPVEADEILITSGSQQGLDLTGKLLLDDGDVVLCESPTYLGAINAFRAYQPQFVDVPTDDHGMIIAELERRIAAHDNIKLAYVVPDFQNPSGRCWSLNRRRAFLEVTSRAGIPVIEDCPYGELRFAGEPVPPLKALDQDGLVVFLGTFSKILCPGLRIGWLAASRDLHSKYVMAKQGADLHTSAFSQYQIEDYLAHNDIDVNIASIRELYRPRRETMLRTMDEEFPAGVTYTRPSGGLFLWAELPAGIDGAKLLQRSLERDVAFVPGGSFFPNGGHDNTMRLNFSAMPLDRIVEGIRRLATVISETLEESPTVPDSAELTEVTC